MLYWYIYRIPPVLVVFMMFIGTFIYPYLMGKINTKYSKHIRIINTVLSLIAVFGILYITVFTRTKGEYSADFMPFVIFKKASQQKEFYREMVMNVFLFFPFGLTLPFIFKKHNFKTAAAVVIWGLILSSAVEFTQYYFSLGNFETDDIICNTLGAAIGVLGNIMFNEKLGVRN